MRKETGFKKGICHEWNGHTHTERHFTKRIKHKFAITRHRAMHVQQKISQGRLLE